MFMRQTIFLALIMVGCNSDYGIGEVESALEIQPGDQVDILMVIDTSCSMMDDYHSIYWGLGKTAEDIQFLEADWTLHMITADQDSDVVVEIDSTSSEPGWDLMAAILEIDSSAYQGEQGFAAALNFEYLMRNNVPSLVMFVSDEPEQSTFSADAFRSYWNNELFVASIVGPYSDINNDDCSAEAAPKYHDASDYYVSICTDQPWSVLSSSEYY